MLFRSVSAHCSSIFGIRKTGEGRWPANRNGELRRPEKEECGDGDAAVSRVLGEVDVEERLVEAELISRSGGRGVAGEALETSSSRSAMAAR